MSEEKKNSGWFSSICSSVLAPMAAGAVEKVGGMVGGVQRTVHFPTILTGRIYSAPTRQAYNMEWFYNPHKTPIPVACRGCQKSHSLEWGIFASPSESLNREPSSTATLFYNLPSCGTAEPSSPGMILNLLICDFYAENGSP